MATLKHLGVAPATVRAKGSTPAYAKRKAGAALALDTARNALKGFDRGGHLFGMNKGQFSMIDIASALLARVGVADVSVWTWCIAEYEVEAVSAFLDAGSIRSYRMVMDWAGANRDMPLIGEMQERYGDDCIRVTMTHAKIVTIATDDGWRIVVRGSMNLNNNPRFEQFDVSDDVATYDMVRGIEAELWERGKPLPVKRLRHHDATALLHAGEVTAPAASWAQATRGWWDHA